MTVAIIDYKKIVVPPSTKKKLQPALSSWRSMHPYIIGIKDTAKNLDMLSALLSLELNSPRPREQIITRLHMKISAMRRELERTRALTSAKA